jgi:hypothetical protein
VDGGGQRLPVAALGGGPHQPEVGDLDRLAGEQDVLRLDVEVGDAGVVGVVERVGDRAEQLGGGLRVQPALGVEQAAERLAADVLHHDPGQPSLLAGVVDGDDVGVGEPGGGPGLPPELLGEGAVAGQLRPGHLDRDRPVELAVVAPVDDRHAALGDAGDNLVPPPAEGSADEAVEGGGVSGHERSRDRCRTMKTTGR